MAQNRAGGTDAPRLLATNQTTNDMAIKLDKQKHKLPTRGRKYSKLGQAVLALKVNESLTVPCKDFDEANSLRQVFNRLKQAGKIHAYRSDWLKAKNRMRVWRLEA